MHHANVIETIVSPYKGNEPSPVSTHHNGNGTPVYNGANGLSDKLRILNSVFCLSADIAAINKFNLTVGQKDIAKVKIIMILTI